LELLSDFAQILIKSIGNMLFITRFVFLGLAASLTLPALAKPKEFPIAENIKTEVCIYRDEPIESKGCLVEIRKDNRSSFFARPDDADLLRSNAVFSKLPFVLEEVSESEYATLQAQTQSTENLRTSSEGAQSSIDSNKGDSSSCNSTMENGSGRCVAGTIGGAILDGLQGASLGPVGAVIGAIGGALVGRAASCGGSSNCGGEASGRTVNGEPSHGRPDTTKNELQL
jgi:outer membrane lipoprotein SlyB